MTDPLREALDEAALLIETGESRAMATDGPVSHFRDELDDREWRRLWVALSKVRALAADTARPTDPRVNECPVCFGLFEDVSEHRRDFHSLADRR